MLNNHEYVNEKLRQFHSETLERRSSRPAATGGWSFPLVSAIGRALSRAGAGIERWARTDQAHAAQEPTGFSGPSDLEPCTDC